MPAPHIVVMGVSGAGKSTVARVIAERTGAPVLDADDLHPPTNRRKLSAGVPLTDEDRRPWLAAVRDRMRERDSSAAGGPGLVVACSALRHAYRDVLRDVDRPVFFVELGTDPDLIAARLAARRGHFASQRILESQLRTLEPLADDENGIVCSIARSAAAISDEVVAAIGDCVTPHEQLDSGRDPKLR
ncbi:gluconokinase [Dietzia sp. ANT_WB102]|uniref:gluconokinase n=1 Tax=Dietzia sp. ANT_WB102 TaxID=2597345 RepID=UPI0011EF3F46|nr:gluconokinase, GntK/IdnK-type [Dietzia sp. ANT_WB102]KAA0917105.1 AAA family ATPase [Dietzia sp. ANT_WB102]